MSMFIDLNDCDSLEDLFKCVFNDGNLSRVRFKNNDF